MPAPWTKAQTEHARCELRELYIRQNKTIGEIARILVIGQTTVYERLRRLGVPVIRHKKAHYNNSNRLITIPRRFTPELAEFVGILLGDGHLTPTQVTVTLGKKEAQYVKYVARLMHKLFAIKPKVYFSKREDWTVYLGSTSLVRWFLQMGLAHNKVQAQVTIPRWCLGSDNFKRRVLRGLIDTDGSIYRLRHGAQISFCNRSEELLKATRQSLSELGFSPSRPSSNKIYLTKSQDLWNYNQQVGFKNRKHCLRFKQFTKGLK